MKDINSLNELIEYVQGRGVACEVSQLYSLCEKLEQQNTALQAHIKDLEEPKTCDGCKYNNRYWFEEHCGHCERGKFSDEYEPK